MDKVGELVDRKRVMVFADDDNAIDCKSHFEYIAHKIDFDAEGFVNAVEEAIAMKMEVANGNTLKRAAEVIKADKPAPAPVEEPEDDLDEEDEVPFDVDDDIDVTEIEFDFDAARTEIRNKNRTGTAEQKKRVKEIIAETGLKLDQIEDEEILTQMLKVFE
jgi:hypothetical protein